MLPETSRGKASSGGTTWKCDTPGRLVACLGQLVKKSVQVNLGCFFGRECSYHAIIYVYSDPKFLIEARAELKAGETRKL